MRSKTSSLLAITIKMCQENKEKVVLITGASSGIGEATAYEFARHGYKVAAHGRNASALSKVIQECDRLSPNDNKVCIPCSSGIESFRL